ncbi:hypothetical protein EsCd1HHP024_00810 [Escherichia sp. HH091_1A]|jgi:hypothetical protein|nr:hypothetical protein EsCd1HHP024_00810 [Escherichia sp. HH091_1A]BDI50042.1 hypothetical protein EsCd1KSP079_00807 [Escherichia sp. KS167_9B]
MVNDLYELCPLLVLLIVRKKERHMKVLPVRVTLIKDSNTSGINAGQVRTEWI